MICNNYVDVIELCRRRMLEEKNQQKVQVWSYNSAHTRDMKAGLLERTASHRASACRNPEFPIYLRDLQHIRHKPLSAEALSSPSHCLGYEKSQARCEKRERSATASSLESSLSVRSCSRFGASEGRDGGALSSSAAICSRTIDMIARCIWLWPRLFLGFLGAWMVDYCWKAGHGSGRLSSGPANEQGWISPRVQLENRGVTIHTFVFQALIFGRPINYTIASLSRLSIENIQTPGC